MRKCISFLFLLLLLISCMPKQQRSALGIHDLQGCEHQSPYKGQPVFDIEGVVTHKVGNGFMLQSMNPDDKDCSSEAIFVFTDTFPKVLPGDLIKVDGKVEEFIAGNEADFNLSTTEIINPIITVIQSNTPLPDPFKMGTVEMDFPDKVIDDDGLSIFDPLNDGLDYYESLESMLVEIEDGIVVAPRNAYNEIFVLREWQLSRNNVSQTGALQNSNSDANPEKIMVKLPSVYKDPVDIGARINGPIYGVMDYSYGNFKVLSISLVEFIPVQKEEPSFMRTDEDAFTIVTYNVENLSPFDRQSRFTRLARQIVDELDKPDILVLHEVMDDSGTSNDGTVTAELTISMLISAIHQVGGGDYEASDATPLDGMDGGIEGGNIRSVLLYRSDKGFELVTPVNSGNDVDMVNHRFVFNNNPIRLFSTEKAFAGTRKPAVWLLEYHGEEILVIGLHLSSQGSNSPDWGSIQPPLKPDDAKRIQQAQLVHQWIQEILTMKPNQTLLVAGDLNSLPWSQTLNTLQGNLLYQAGERIPQNERYSYIFEGNAQQLDYVLINKERSGDLLQAQFVHLNSGVDESRQLSDHDTLIAEIRIQIKTDR